MSVDMKLGRWRARDGFVYNVDEHRKRERWPWLSVKDRTAWDDHGFWANPGDQNPNDLVQYLGPLSAPLACADQAGTVSIEAAADTLRRMRVHWNLLCREETVYGEALAGVRKAKSDLEEAIKTMEKEVERCMGGVK